MLRARHACLALPALVCAPAAAQCELPSDDLAHGDADFSLGEALVTFWNGTGPEARLYARGPGGWTFTHRFHVGDQLVFFRLPVALENDRGIVGAPEAATDLSGRAYVLERVAGSWTQIELAASNAGPEQWFGSAVDLSGDVAVVGAIHARGTLAPGDGQSRAYVFERIAGVWTEVLELPVIGSGFGKSVAVDGDTIVVGAHLHDGTTTSQSGIVHVFQKIAGTWTQVQTLEPAVPLDHAHFGWAVELRGNTLVVGAPNRDLASTTSPGFVEVFHRDGGGTWTRQERLLASDAAPRDLFGQDLSLGLSALLVGAPGREVAGVPRGAVYRFDESPGGWVETDLVARDDTVYFGETVAFRGNHAVLGNWSRNRFYSLGIARAKSFCAANPNSTGSPASISAEGCDSIAGNELTLTVQPLPAGQVGLLFFGTGKQQVALGDGFLCVAAGYKRFPVRSVDASGALVEEVDFTQLPAATITAGSTWTFQAYYTDPAAGGSGFNFSDGLAVTIEP